MDGPDPGCPALVPQGGMIHFDTNFLVRATVTGSPAHQEFRQWSAAAESFGVSAVAWAEYLCGPLDPKGEAIARQIFPSPESFLTNDAALAADLFNKTGCRSRSLADCMIAATAIRCGAKLGTINLNHFRRFTQFGLTLA